MIDPQLARAVAAINKELAKLQQKVRLIQQGQTRSQLGRSSIDDGTLLVLSGGTVRQTIGVQPDGTVTTVDQNGPAPPVPSAPGVVPAPGGLTAIWDGTFTGGAAQPADFADIEVHLSATPGFTPSGTTLRGTLLKAGQITIQPLASTTTFYIGLVAVNTSGNKSAVSTEVPGIPQAALISPITASEIGYIGVLNANPYLTGGDGAGWASGGGTPGASITVASQDSASPYPYPQQPTSDIVGGSAASRVVGTAFQSPTLQPSAAPSLMPLAGAGFLGTPGVVSVVTNQPAGSPYTYALRLISNVTGGGTAYEPGPPAFPVVPGQQYLVTGLFYTPGTSVSLGLSFLLNGVWIADVTEVTPVSANTWTQVTSVITAPSGVNSAGPVFFTPGMGSQYTMYGQAVVALPQVPGALIQAGTVTAIQIAAGTVVAGIIDGTIVETATLILDTSGSGSGAFIYNGIGTFGNLIGSWAAADGVDVFGNPYEAGLTATQGQLTGIGISNADIEQSEINFSNIDNSTINNPSVVGGTILETDIVFDTVGGRLLIYAKTTATTTLSGEGTWTAPAGSTGTAKIECWGGGGGGGNNTSASGGGGGGGGEYACEPNYPIVEGQDYTYNVGAGGAGTTNGRGGKGNDTWFDARSVYAYGGQGGGTNPSGFWIGGLGGAGSTNTIRNHGGNGGNGYGPNGGGGGGGSSAGPAAVGGDGSDSPHNSSGGGGGTAPAGGGNGGTGGNFGAAGSGGTAPGGGGGGSGDNGGSSSRTDTFYPTGTYSYYGADNTEGFPRTLSNTNGNMQQGCANDPSLGTFFSFAHFNSSAIVSALSGRTIDSVSITVDCLHSWYNSGMTVYLDYSGVSSFPSPISIPSSTHIGSYAIGEGKTATFSVPNSVGSAFQSGSAQSLYFHAPNQSLNYYGYFQGGTGGNAPHLSVTSHTGTSPVSSGAGAAGQLKVTYTASVALIASFSGTAFTDVYGNSVPVGVMVNGLAAVQPGSSPAVEEVWHTPGGVGSGWAIGPSSGNVEAFQYRLLPDGNVHLSGVFHNTSTTPAATIFVLPSGYYNPVNSQRFNVNGQQSTTITPNVGTIDTSGNVSLINNPTVSNTNFNVDAIIRIT